MECLDEIDSNFGVLNENYTYIIKLVYKYNFMKLPNIIIHSKKRFTSAKKNIETYDTSLLSEIWYCKNNTKKNSTIFGRMLFSNSQLFPDRANIRYELVWGTSARTIEQFPQMDCSFVSVERTNWNSPLKYLEVNAYDILPEDLYYISDKIIRMISASTSRIKEFGSFVFSMGCNHLCLEFSYFNNELNFIDWDTDNDKKILIGSDIQCLIF